MTSGSASCQPRSHLSLQSQIPCGWDQFVDIKGPNLFPDLGGGIHLSPSNPAPHSSLVTSGTLLKDITVCMQSKDNNLSPWVAKEKLDTCYSRCLLKIQNKSISCFGFDFPFSVR